MAQRTPLVIRIGVVASSLLLVTGFIGYRSGFLFSGVANSRSTSPILLDLNALPADPPGERSDRVRPNSAAAPDLQQSPSEALGVAPQVGSPSLTADIRLNAHELAVKDINQFGMLVRVPEDQIDAMRRQPGKASPILIQHDAVKRFMTRAPSSKSAVLLPPQPPDLEKAIRDYRSMASTSFSKSDRNSDGKLTVDEIGEYYWKHFEQMSAVENGAIDPEAFLKNYAWFSNQK